MTKKLIFVFSLIINIGFSQEKFELINNRTEQIVNQFLEKNNIPGMSVSISVNDTLIFSKGFGYSDIENKIKVDAVNRQQKVD